MAKISKVKVNLVDILKKFSNAQLLNDSIAFDTEIVGRDGRSVFYTHGFTENGKYWPHFLTMERGTDVGYYVIGCIPCKQWLMTGKIE